jgi:hypothetical protein
LGSGGFFAVFVFFRVFRAFRGHCSFISCTRLGAMLLAKMAQGRRAKARVQFWCKGGSGAGCSGTGKGASEKPAKKFGVLLLKKSLKPMPVLKYK